MEYHPGQMVPYADLAQATHPLEALAAARVRVLKSLASGLWGSAAFEGVYFRPDLNTFSQAQVFAGNDLPGGVHLRETTSREHGAIVATPLRIDKHGTERPL
jgi:hypothetical protein